MTNRKPKTENRKSASLRLALLQHVCAEDPQANLQTCTEMIRDAAGRGADLIITQELFASRYFPRTEDEAAFDLAEPIPGPTSRRLGELAKELGVWISGSLFEKRAVGVYHNTSVMIGPDGAIADRYRKMHIPDDPGFYEKYYFTPGDLGFKAPPLDGLAGGGVRAGMLVCWDQWFPEAARLTAMKGAELLLYPTAIAWHMPAAGGEPDPPEVRAEQLEAWRTVHRAHAVTNGVFVAAANRIGREGELVFWGHSMICDPAGNVIAEAPADEPAVLMAELDRGRIASMRHAWPFLRDRRIDAYDGLTRRYLDD